MESVLVRERYKVTRVLAAEADYALLEAVDIQDRETPQRLLNVYGGPLLWRYADIYDRVGRRPGYYGMFLSGERLVAVFDDCRGRGIDEVFHKRDSWDWQSRLEFAQELMHCALGLADLPPEVGCSALLPENLMTDVEGRRFRIRFMVPPMEEMDRRELARLAGGQVRKILRPRFSSADAELDFLSLLDLGCFPGIVPLYARWLEAREEIREEYETLNRKNAFKRWCTFLIKNIRRKMKRKPR